MHCLTATASLLISLSVLALPDQAFSARLGNGHLYFTENLGQWDERVLFKAEGGSGLTWWFERDGFTLAVTVPDSSHSLPATAGWQDDPGVGGNLPTPVIPPSKGHALKLRFVPSHSTPSSDFVFASNEAVNRTQPAAEVIAEGELNWNNNYFLGNDQSKWAPNCGNFTRLTYREVWPGIDIVFYGEGKSLKYDYVIKAGADPSNVRLRWLGLTENIQACKDDRVSEFLLLATSVGSLKEGIPESYQRDDIGNRIPIAVTFKVLSENEVGLDISGDWDREKELVVDPLVYSTFVGGNDDDQMYWNSAALDGAGCVIVAGNTRSQDFPRTEGAFQDQSIGAFITRMNADGTEPIYGAIVGSATVRALLAEEDGSALIAGGTWNREFPTTEGAWDTDFNDGSIDGFIARLSPEGNRLNHCTLLGGDSDDLTLGIAQSDAGEIISLNVVYNGDFPVSEGAIDETANGGYDVVFAGFNSELSQLTFATYLGGSEDDYPTNIINDGNGAIIASGNTESWDYPTTEGAFDRQLAAPPDMFLVKIPPDGNRLIYSTLVGGDYFDIPGGLIPDGQGGALAAGYTGSRDYPTTEGVILERQPRDGNWDAYVTHINAEGSELIYSTYLGGQGLDWAFAIAPDGAGGAFVAGNTTGSFPITNDAFDSTYNGDNFDCFIARLNGDGSQMLYGTYLGGEGTDQPYALFSDGGGGLIVCGTSTGRGYPTTEGAFQRQNRGQQDIFITKMSSLVPVWWEELPSLVTATENETVEFDIRARSIIPDDGQYELSFTAPEDFRNVQFEDNGDGSGRVAVPIPPNSAGEHQLLAHFFDGENELEGVIRLVVDFYPIYFSNIPDTVRGMEGVDIEFEVEGRGREGDGALLIRFERGDLPESANFEFHGDNFGTFGWIPSADDAGEYHASFILTEGEWAVTQGVAFIITESQGAGESAPPIPSTLYLASAFPNPFNSSASIRFGIPSTGEVELRILDMSGRRVATLAQGLLPAGHHEYSWNASQSPGGLYLVELTWSGNRLTRKTTVIK